MEDCWRFGGCQVGGSSTPFPFSYCKCSWDTEGCNQREKSHPLGVEEQKEEKTRGNDDMIEPD